MVSTGNHKETTMYEMHKLYRDKYKCWINVLMFQDYLEYVGWMQGDITIQEELAL